MDMYGYLTLLHVLHACIEAVHDHSVPLKQHVTKQISPTSCSLSGTDES